MQTVFVQLNSPLGSGMGPFTVTTVPAGVVNPTNTFTSSQLLSGVYIEVNDGITNVVLTSEGNCSYFPINLVVPTTTSTSTSTTTSTTTTSTTTIAPPPNICWIIRIESGSIYYENFPIGTSPALYNGKVWYGGASDRCVYWDNTLNKWVYDFDGLGGGVILGSLDNNDNDYPISDSTYQWDPGCDSPVTETICSSEATACPENICFYSVSEVFGNIFEQSVSPETTLINGKLWYKLIVDPSVPQVLYVYWDNTSTYQPGGAWVVGYGTSTSLTPPFVPLDVWAYLPGNTGNYPDDCAFNCTPSVWTNTDSSPGDFVFSTLSRGECPATTTSTTTASPCADPVCGQTYEGYGYLYNWWAIFGAGAQTNGGRNVGGIVNTNQGYTDERNQWVVPSDSDWNDLIGFLDPTYNPTIIGIQSATAGGKLKTICTTPFNVDSGVWDTPNGGATNQYLWAGVPGGVRGSTGSFSFINEFGLWWSTTERTVDNSAWYRSLNYNLPSVNRFSRFKMEGLSLRLVRPATTAELLLDDGTTSNQDPTLPHYIGNSRTYITVKIGNQVWTAQNLIDTTYNDSTSIPEVTDNTTWNGLTIGARCSYNNGSITPNQGQIELCGVPTCGGSPCRILEVNISQIDLDDATGNSTPTSNGKIVVQFYDCNNIFNTTIVDTAGTYLVPSGACASSVITLVYSKNDVYPTTAVNSSANLSSTCCS